MPRLLKIMQHISLDGIIQNTDDDDHFPFTDWTAPYRTAQGRDLILAANQESFDLLLGRRTYDLWMGFWPTSPESAMSIRINTATKYVVTHRVESLAWGPCEGLDGTKIVQEVHRIKSQDGPEIVVWGSSSLTSMLLEHGLVNEVLLMIYPVFLGAGKRMFAQGTPPRSFDLLSTQTTSTGITLNHYKFAGPLKTA